MASVTSVAVLELNKPRRRAWQRLVKAGAAGGSGSVLRPSPTIGRHDSPMVYVGSDIDQHDQPMIIPAVDKYDSSDFTVVAIYNYC